MWDLESEKQQSQVISVPTNIKIGTVVIHLTKQISGFLAFFVTPDVIGIL